MNGVHILNHWEEVTKTVFSWKSFWIGAIIGAVLTIIFIALIMMEDWDWSCFGVLSSIFIPIVAIGIGLLSGFFIAPTPVEYETHYEVSINEEVLMSDFMEKYEILETRGSIYIVKERK